MSLLSSLNRFLPWSWGCKHWRFGWQSQRDTEQNYSSASYHSSSWTQCRTPTGMAIHDLQQYRVGRRRQNCITYFSCPKFWVLITYPLEPCVRHQLYEKVFCSNSFEFATLISNPLVLVLWDRKWEFLIYFIFTISAQLLCSLIFLSKASAPISGIRWTN